MTLDPGFVANASVPAIRAQYEQAQAHADLWADRARELFLLLCQREEQATRAVSTRARTQPIIKEN